MEHNESAMDRDKVAVNTGGGSKQQGVIVDAIRSGGGAMLTAQAEDN